MYKIRLRGGDKNLQKPSKKISKINLFYGGLKKIQGIQEFYFQIQ